MPFYPAVQDQSGQIMMAGLARLGSGIGGGLEKLGEGIGKLMEKKKNDAKLSDQLGKLIETAYPDQADISRTWSLTQKAGFVEGKALERALAKLKDQNEQAGALQAFGADVGSAATTGVPIGALPPQTQSDIYEGVPGAPEGTPAGNAKLPLREALLYGLSRNPKAIVNPQFDNSTLALERAFAPGGAGRAPFFNVTDVNRVLPIEGAKNKGRIVMGPNESQIIDLDTSAQEMRDPTTGTLWGYHVPNGKGGLNFVKAPLPDTLKVADKLRALTGQYRALVAIPTPENKQAAAEVHDQIQAIMQPSIAQPGSSGAAGTRQAPIRVKTPAEAKAVKPGQWFQTPDGRTLLRGQ